MNSPKNVRSLARVIALGLMVSAAGTAAAQTEGDKTPNSRKPVVGIVNPGAGVVTSPFRVQVRVFSPLAADGVTPQSLTSVTLDYVGPDSGTITLSPNPNYTGSNPQSGIWEGVADALMADIYELRVTATNASGSVQSGPVVVVVNAGRGDGNLLVRDNGEQMCSDCHAHKSHSSEAMGTKYGSWYTGCRTCHQPHNTTNASLIANTIQPPDVNVALPPKPVIFSNRRGYYANGGASSPSAATYANGDRTGVCQVCHTQTQFYREDGNDYPAPTFAAVPSGSHYPTQVGGCMSCHSHKDGMKANCSSCHGAAGGRAPAIAGVTDPALAAAPPITPTTTAPIVVSGGRHDSHTNKDRLRTNAYLCSDCHANASHNGAVSFGWSTAATGTGAKLVTVYPAGNTTTTWVNNPTCTNYCHGASLADSIPPLASTRIAVKWNTASTLTCGSCHGAPPNTGSHNSTMTECTPCHENGYSPTAITTSAAKLLHIDGKVDSSGCNGCHGDPARQALPGSNSSVQNAPPKRSGGNVLTDTIDLRGVGVHQAHVNVDTTLATTIANPIACSECHATVDAPTHPENDGEGDIVFGTIASKGTGRGFAYPSCNVYCHAPTGTSSLSFYTAATLTCASCHGNAASLSSGSHALHVADAGTYKGTTYNCLTCHPDVASTNATITDKAAHVDGTNTVAALTSWSDAGKTCASNACHSDGRETPSFVSATWGAGAAGGTCTECHGREAGSIAGAPWYANVYPGVQTANSHDKHVTTAADCAKCHPTTVDATGKILAGGGDHLKNGRNVSAGSGITFTYDESAETCSNISCHGNKSATWGAPASCTDCHGDTAKIQSATTVDPNWQSAPPYDAAGGSTGVKVGAHAKHTNSSTFREAAFACTECHTAASLTSHNQTRDAGWGIIATNNSAVAATPLAGTGAYDAWASPYNCTNYCHGATLTGGTNTSPSWTATGMTCTSCHGTTGLATGSHALHLADAATYKGTTYGCVTCHDTADNASILIKSQHLDRAVSTAGIGFIGGACTSNACHSDGRETPSFVSATWGAGAAGGTCTECHGREAGSIAGAPWYANVYPGVQTANSHDKHVTTAADCAKCHPTTVDATGKILAGGGDHLKNGRNVSAGSGITFTYDESAETCSNISCHGNKSATWGAPASCTDCHGDINKTKTATTVDPLWVAAPPTDTTGATTGVKVGAHYEHTTSNTYRTAGLQCVDCHTAASLTSHNQSRDPFWSTLATGSGAVTPTPAAGTGGYDIWPSPYNCTNYCHGATLGGGTTTTVSWTATFASVTCNQCHGAPPPVDTAGNDHPQNTACANCHGAGYAVGSITGAALTNHISGFSLGGTDKPNNGCTACHGTLAGYSGGAVLATSMTAAPGYNATGVDTTGGSAVTSVRVGAHDAHVRPAGSLSSAAAFDCTACHGTKPVDGNTAHANATVLLGWNAVATGGATVTPSPTTFAGWASPYNCTNYCHSNAAPLGGTNSTPTFSWTAGTANLNCNSCHQTATFGGTGLSAKHQKHLTGYAYKCDECHATTMTDNSSSSIGTPANHVNGSHPPTFSSTMLTTTVNNQAGAYAGSPGYGCTATYCHSSGTTTTPPYGATTNPTAMSWSTGTTSATCDNCHGGNSSATYKLATGSHTGHVNVAANYTGNFGCAMCHSATSATDTTFSTVTNHVNGLKEVSAASWNGTTCASNACHSNGTESLVTADYKSVTWGNTLANDCKGCHGTEAGSIASAPWYANDAGSYKTRNSHQAHIAATDTATVCNTCHSATVGATGILTVAAHLDLDGVPEVGGSSIGSYSDATETCNSVSCHGGNSPQWGATLDCSACHMGATGATDAEVDNYVYGTNPMAKLDPEDWINYGHGKASGAYDSGNTAAAFDTAIAVSADDGCKFCHDKNVDHGLTTNPFRLANVGAGTTDAQKVGVCTVCHGGTGYLGKSSAKAIDATHYGTKHAANGKGGELCWDCHDPHGDYKYSATPGVLAYMIDETPVITHTVAEGSATQWGQNAITTAATPEFNKSFGTNATAWDWGDYARSTRTGVCQVCHTQTLHFKNTTWVTTAGGDSNHNDTAGRCTSCHGHDQAPTSAFKESGCNGCHGTATPRTPVTVNADPMLDFAPPKGAPPENSTATSANEVGAHYSHINQISLRADPLLCSDCHGTGLPKHAGGAYATISWGALATTGLTPTTPTYTQGAGCASTYCHGNFKNGNDQITAAIPGAPADLAFSAVTNNTLTLSWTGASGATIYKVERAPNVSGAPGTFVQIGTTTGTTYADGGLWAATMYWYRVRAWSSAGDGVYSGNASQVMTGGTPGTSTSYDFDMIGSATTTIDGGSTNVTTTTTALTAGTTVTNRVIATQNATYSSTTQRRDRPTAAISSGTYYFIDMFTPALTSTNYNVAAGVTVSIDTLVGTAGTANPAYWTATLYEYTAAGVSNQTGTCMAPYNSTSTTRVASTCTMNNPDWAAAVGSRLKLRIQQDPTSNFGRVSLLWGSTPSTTAGQTFFTASLGTAAVPPALPAAATGTPAIPTFSGVGSTSMTLTWLPGTVAAQTSYKVERSLNGTSGWVQVGQPTVASFTDGGLNADTQFYYRVKASSAGGDSATYSPVGNQRTAVSSGANATAWTGTFTEGSTTLTCTSCHGNPPGGTHPNQTGCNTCHPGYSATAVVKATHINQAVDVVTDCTICHALAMGTRDAVVSEFTNTWSHKRSFTGTPKVNRWDCIVCHMEGDTDGALSTTYHMNGKLNFRDPDLGTNIMAATGFSQTVYTDSNNGGAYTFSTTVEAAPTGFSRNLAVAFQSDPNWLDLAAIQVNLCLKCHDSNGANAFATGQPLAAFASSHGFTAEKPFGQTISGTAYTGAGITANGMLGGVADVKSSFLTTNASYHPVLGKQNNSYANNALMASPWNTLSPNKTGGTINAAASWGFLISCWDCHAPNGTLSTVTLTRSNTAHGAATTIRQAVWTSSTTVTNNLCRVCHAVATSGGHGATSAVATVSASDPNSYFGGQCYRCHASSSATPARPIRGQDSHGFNRFAPAAGTDTWWPFGTTNTYRPYAFMRSISTTGGSWRSAGWRPRILPTAEGGTGTANCAGECNGENTSATYSPGGVY